MRVIGQIKQLNKNLKNTNNTSKENWVYFLRYFLYTTFFAIVYIFCTVPQSMRWVAAWTTSSATCPTSWRTRPPTSTSPPMPPHRLRACLQRPARAPSRLRLRAFDDLAALSDAAPRAAVGMETRHLAPGERLSNLSTSRKASFWRH